MNKKFFQEKNSIVINRNIFVARARVCNGTVGGGADGEEFSNLWLGSLCENGKKTFCTICEIMWES